MVLLVGFVSSIALPPHKNNSFFNWMWKIDEVFTDYLELSEQIPISQTEGAVSK
jgi:hypothetical protein